MTDQPFNQKNLSKKIHQEVKETSTTNTLLNLDKIFQAMFFLKKSDHDQLISWLLEMVKKYLKSSFVT